VVLARALESFYAGGDRTGLDGYSAKALQRVWRAQHFSWWMTSMLHRAEDQTDFDRRRQIGELDLLTTSTAGSTYLAEAYTGWPLTP
jgi:p-hydroxybenzoate 3-monooxygenase